MTLREKLLIQVGEQNDNCKFCEVKDNKRIRYGFCHCPAVLEEDKGFGAMILSCDNCEKFEAGVFKKR
ncbi:MAG: hypothetical protein KAW92_10620 [Candidatus Cloacimonetes bacterium]|nr:hypothetical protein [Candidatus Cloacimonadota bacterium]